MHHGSCLCGRVRFVIHGRLRQPLNCHCSLCRKAQGAAFRSRATVHTDEFQWLAGEAQITWYESSRGTWRGFCKYCGSRLVSRFDSDPNTLGIPLGCLDDSTDIKPLCHVYVASKASWYDITDNLPQYKEVP